MDLQAIKAREAAATKGPWGAHEACRPAYCEIHNAHTLENGESAIALVEYPENVQFIAHAREDVPALVAEVERLTELTQHLGTCEDCNTAHECLVDSLRADVADLQKQLAAAKKDLTENRVCRACENYLDRIECKTTLCGACTNRENYFEWRGPQEGETGGFI